MSGLTQEQLDKGAALAGITGSYDVVSNAAVIGETGVAARADLRPPPECCYCGATLTLLTTGNLIAAPYELGCNVASVMETTAPGGDVQSADTVAQAKDLYSAPSLAETQRRINQVFREMMLKDP
jgi:hypothetical protein